MDVLVVGNPTSPYWILHSAKKFNVARPDLQQREIDSTPFIISKTNSNETIVSQRAEVGSQRRRASKSSHSVE